MYILYNNITRLHIIPSPIQPPNVFFYKKLHWSYCCIYNYLYIHMLGSSYHFASHHIASIYLYIHIFFHIMVILEALLDSIVWNVNVVSLQRVRSIASNSLFSYYMVICFNVFESTADSYRRSIVLNDSIFIINAISATPPKTHLVITSHSIATL